MKAFFEKYGIWIVLGFIILWLVKIQRTMSLQNTLIISLAKKAGLELSTGKNKKEDDDEEFTEHEDVTGKDGEEEEEQEEEKKELTEDEINQLVEDMQRISAQIKNKQPVSKEDQEYYRLFINDMHPDLKLEPIPESGGATIIPLHPASKTEEKTETTQNSQAQTISNPETNSNTTEKPIAKTNIEKTLLTGKEGQKVSVPIKKYTAQEKKDLIVTFFVHTPLYQKEVAEKLATATGTKLNPGNTNGLVSELLEEKKLMEHPLKVNGKTYYGLPAWFEKKKLTKDYIKKIK